MILAEVRDYLAKRGRAPLTDLTARFDVDADAARAMLEHLIRKGRVRRIDAGDNACGSCCGCAEEGTEVYEWTGRR
jgi:Mn-dependent DtxR family transcriptional regulator